MASCDDGGGSGNKSAGTAVSAPALVSKTATSITINAVAAPSNGQTVGYARNRTDTASSSAFSGTYRRKFCFTDFFGSFDNDYCNAKTSSTKTGN
jgi:hypothetical protein